MSLMTRAVGALVVLSVAAIPVAALTIKNTSETDVSVAVDNGTNEAVYQVPAGGSVGVKEDCSSDCAVTGPWGYSRLVTQNATIETDGTSAVTANAAPASQGLVPQNPIADVAPEAAPAPAAEQSGAEAQAAKPAPRKRVAKSRKAAKQASKDAAGSGSFQMLFQGPGK
jgi:hypothetical protein